MGKKRKELSHEEIWDDSGLLDAWNESYEEYKLYHSIHARGERVSDVLDAAEAAEEGHTEDGLLPGVYQSTKPSTDPVYPSTAQAEDAKIGTDMQISDSAAHPMLSDVSQNTPAGGEPRGLEAQSLEAVQAAPHPMIAHSSTDQGLKDLMMSWYWAGYYTGLYEGQRQVPQPSRQSG